jgi:hypothetical protein
LKRCTALIRCTALAPRTGPLWDSCLIAVVQCYSEIAGGRTINGTSEAGQIRIADPVRGICEVHEYVLRDLENTLVRV